MKLKTVKNKASSDKTLVGIKKTKNGIQKAKKSKKTLKESTVNATAAGTGTSTPLTFAEKKVLSVKRKSNAAKNPDESKPTLSSADSVLVTKKSKKQINKASEKSKNTDENSSKQETNSDWNTKAWTLIKELKKKEKKEGGNVATTVSEETMALVPTQLISKDSFKKVFKVLQSQVEKNPNKLFGGDLKYSIQITAAKIPRCPLRNSRITLPFPVLRDVDEICLIVADLKRGRTVDFQPTQEHWEDKLRELGVTNPIQIMPFQQLKQDYRAFDMKRKLVHRFERFLVDARIDGHVFSFLGSHFAKRCKNPVAVKLDKEENIKKNIEKALHVQTYRQGNSGTTTDIKIGAQWMPADQVVENGMNMLEQLKTVYPGGWLNILALHLCTCSEKMSTFPLYVSVIDPNLIPTPMVIGPKEKFIKKQKDLIKKRTGGMYEVDDDGIVQKARKMNDDGTLESEEELVMDELENEQDDNWLPYDDEPSNKERGGRVRHRHDIKIRVK
ncbi:ribosomal L1 domain-containing protein CG13096 [Anopheles nili]|uniref:ribosomal L1 domain-containing protein CG13096 n=1 Tax=Anopheles nili TaxID=185578 RepID=UPI00237B8B21|nr:ribosomal L1 domain-containing protein CG13096 [Anopheles nili]